MNTISGENYDFANILFSGNCNAQCPYCIGQQLGILYPANLDTFPLKNFVTFLELIKKHSIPEVIFTGTTTDPLLYRHQDKLLNIFETENPEIRRAIHTNGFLILRQLDMFQRYTKCTLSLPSFRQEVFEIMMGTKQAVPDIQTISTHTDIPIKVSRIIDNTNNFLEETEHFFETLASTKVTRVAFRKLAGDMSSWESTIQQLETLGAKYIGDYKNNLIYSIGNIEITLWSFDNTNSQSINLFSNGHISHEYLLRKSEK